MFPLLDLIAGIGGLIVPPVFDFIKKKFIPAENDTPERTISSLATTNPDVLPGYVDSLSKYKDAEIRYFNRDISGTPSLWVINTRAIIRPVGVILSFVILIGLVVASVIPALMPSVIITAISSEVITGVRITCELMVSSWFGHRVTLTR